MVPLSKINLIAGKLVEIIFVESIDRLRPIQKVKLGYLRLDYVKPN